MITQVIYTSYARDPSGSQSDADILAVATDRNRSLDLTGHLFRTDRCFVQLLEGPRRAVEIIMQSIANDPRHRDLHIWPMVEVATRSFPDWSMGYDDVLKERDISLVNDLRASGMSFAALRTHVEVMAQPL